MQARLSKNFITIALTMVIILGGLSFLWGQSRQADEVAVSHAQTVGAAQPSSNDTANDTAQSGQQAGEDAQPASSEEAYRAGYRDGHNDCVASHSSSSASRRTARRTAARSGVAGERYERRRGSSTKDLILTLAAPAAIGAGIGGIAGGKKGAGIGALLGGGGGAAYYLYKNRRKR